MTSRPNLFRKPDVSVKTLKILFVALRWDYKDPARGDSFEVTNFYDALLHMPEVEVTHFAFDAVERAVGRREMNRQLVEQVQEEGPDLVFFFLFEDEFDPATVDAITSRVPTFNWFADDQWRFEIYSKRWAKHFTLVSTTDPDALNRYHSYGIRNVILTQWACNHNLYRPIPVEQDIDVSFVGQRHGDRGRYIQRLHDSGRSVQTWGYGWPNGRLTQDDMISTFSRTKVNLNLSNASRPNIASALLTLAKQSAIDRKLPTSSELSAAVAVRPDQVKGRNFEIPGCRGMLLTSAVRGLEEFFEIGREIEVFRNPEELLEKCNYYVSNTEERRRVAEAGYSRTLSEHTYAHRFQAIFREFGFDQR